MAENSIPPQELRNREAIQEIESEPRIPSKRENRNLEFRYSSRSADSSRQQGAERERVTSPELVGDTMTQAWKNVLVDPTRYQVFSPEELLSPVTRYVDTAEVLSYLRRRYWKS